MNPQSIILLLVIAVIVILAIRRIQKKGACDCNTCNKNCPHRIPTEQQKELNKKSLL